MNFITIFSYYFLTLIIVYFVSRKLNLYDKPNIRKIHKNKVLNTSGLALYVFLFLISAKYELSYEIELIIIIGSIIILVGLLDDRKNLTPGIKLMLLFFPILYLIFNGFILLNLGTYEIIGKIELNKFGLIFSLLAVGLLVNSYNYLDGIDGLLLSFCITTFIYFNFLLNDKNINTFFLLIIFPMIINLLLNFLPETSKLKMFSGNAGSLFLGFLISFVMIFLFKYKGIHPAYLIWSCWLPVYDFIYITFLRIAENKKFYEPDRRHFHHIILFFMKKSHLKTCLILNCLNIFFMILGYLITSQLGKIYSIIAFVLLFIIFIYIRHLINRGVEQSGSSSGS